MANGGSADGDQALELVSAEEQYWMLLDRLPIVAYAAAMDATGGNIHTTSHAVAIYGHTAEEFGSDPDLWQKVIHPDDRERVTRAYAAAVASRRPFHEVYRIVRPDGSVRWVRDDSRPTTSADGLEVMHGVLIDIHAEHEATEAVQRARDDLEERVVARTRELEGANRNLADEVRRRRRSEAEASALETRYRSLVEQLPAVVYLDEVLPGGEIRPSFIGPHVLELTGLRPEEILHSQQAWHAIVHPDDRERVIREDRDHVLVEGDHSREYRVLDRTGRQHWILDRCRVVPPADDLPGFDQGVVIDVTEQRLAEAELRRLTDLHASILESTDEGIYGIDQDGRTTFINRAAAELLGWRSAELAGRPIHAIVHHSRPDGTPYPVAECPIYAALHDGISHAVDDEVFWRRDGSPVAVAYRSSPIFAGGDVAGAVVVFSDVTSGRAAAAEFRALNEELEARVAARTAAIERSEARWRSLIDSAPGSIVTLDRTGRFTYVSRVEGGYEPEDLLATTIFSTVAEEYHPTLRAALAATFERGEQTSYEVPVSYPDGSTAWYEARLSRIDEDEAVLFGIDVTERRRDEERRRVQYQVADTLAGSGTIGEGAPRVLEAQAEAMGWDLGELWVADTEGAPMRRVAVWSRPGLDITAFESRTREVEGDGRPGLPSITSQHQRPVWWDPLPESAFPRAAAAAAVGLSSAVEIPVAAGDRTVGVIVFFARRLGAIEAEVEALRAFGTAVGAAIERWRTAEALLSARDEAEQANRAKSEMLSRMSHELRTPLNSILGFGQLLEDAELAPDDRDSVGQMVAAGRRLLDLVDRVLDVARLDAGRGVMTLEAVDVAGIVRTAFDAIRARADERQVGLHLDPGGSASAWTDAARLSSIVRTLIVNAVMHNRSGGSVGVSLRVKQDRLTVEVADSGRGIEPDRLERIFRPFEPSISGPGASVSGLSLALARRNAEAMAGRLTVTSTPGLGSVFSLDLPLAVLPSREGAEVVAIVTPATRPSVVAALAPIAGVRLVFGESEASISHLVSDAAPPVTILEAGAGDGDASPRSLGPTIVLGRHPAAHLEQPPPGVELLAWPANRGELAAAVAARLANREEESS